MNKKRKIGLIVGICNFVAIMLLAASELLIPSMPNRAQIVNPLCKLSEVLSLPLWPLFSAFIKPHFISNIILYTFILVPWCLLNAYLWGLAASLLVKKNKANQRVEPTVKSPID